MHDAQELAALGDEELQSELEQEFQALQQIVDQLEFHALFSGRYDEEDALLAIHAGAGGTEAQDWAQMLQRMIIRWAESHGLTVEVLDESSGDEAGIKSTLMVSNNNRWYFCIVVKFSIYQHNRKPTFYSTYIEPGLFQTGRNNKSICITAHKKVY